MTSTPSSSPAFGPLPPPPARLPTSGLSVGRCQVQRGAVAGEEEEEEEREGAKAPAKEQAKEGRAQVKAVSPAVKFVELSQKLISL